MTPVSCVAIGVAIGVSYSTALWTPIVPQVVSEGILRRAPVIVANIGGDIVCVSPARYPASYLCLVHLVLSGVVRVGVPDEVIGVATLPW